MIKGEVKEKGRTKFFLISLIFFILFINFLVIASAIDVAYIYRRENKIDENILDIFQDLGLSVETIQENNLPENFDNYNFIFVGDERFRNADEIPVYEKPSVIANYYFGEEFGLTDYDGVSKLGANSPLSVRLVDNGIQQVYTQAEFNGRSIAIPYYYLDDENKAPGFESVARTYTGNGNGYNFGDVISYTSAGTYLVNGYISKGKICFYGIIESDYWTSAARQMFIDCVGYVSITCEEDSDCGEQQVGELYCSEGDVYQDTTIPVCENPGTSESNCNIEVEMELIDECIYGCSDGQCNEGQCLDDSDCDEDYYSENYCVNDSVYHNLIDFSCVDFFCESETIPELVEQCSDICRDGECIERECVEDSDCQEDYYSDSYCSNENVYHDLHDFSCSQENCVENIIQELVEDCEENEMCVDGECRTIECSLNSDCGENAFLGWRYCLNDNVYEDFISFTCFNPGTINSYCVNYTLPILVDWCEFDCVSGECITCFNNLSCGINGFIGDKYCENNSVYQNYQQFECINPGTSESDCLSSVFSKLLENCEQDQICVLGECEDIECFNNSDCNDYDAYTIDTCVLPGTINSYCYHTPINCIEDSDCGITGFIGEEYCFEDDTYKDYQNSTCIGAGTINSYCGVSIESRFLKDCGEDYCNSWSNNYCKGDDVYHSRTCYDVGCTELNGHGCFNNTFQEEQLVENCSFDCVNGTCIGECNIDEDCDNGLYCDGEEICVENFCEAGIPVDCSDFDILGISTCNNIPDGNNLTWDYRDSFTSVCNEDLDSCTFGSHDITHTCDISCGAECVINEDCPEKCTQESHKLYEFLSCEDCECKYGSYSCVIGKCGAECSPDTEETDCSCPVDTCDGTTLIDYPEHGECGTSGSEGCLCQACEATEIPNSILCGYVPCVDNDSDEYNVTGGDCGPIDCDDSNPLVNPGADEICDNGIDDDCDGLIDENDPDCFECFDNEDCGNISSELICIDANLTNHTINPICVDGFCSEEIIDEFIAECVYGCFNGRCLPECIEDSDCQEDYYSDSYCSNENVYHDLHDFSCVLGTCQENIIQELVEDCGEDYCNSWSNNYCKGDDVYHSRTCYNITCSVDSCVNNSYFEEQLVQECVDTCLNGVCIEILCYNDSDCGTDRWVGDNYCIGDDVYKDYETFTCALPGTVDSECLANITPILIQECEFGCANGTCLGICDDPPEGCYVDGPDLVCEITTINHMVTVNNFAPSYYKNFNDEELSYTYKNGYGKGHILYKVPNISDYGSDEVFISLLYNMTLMTNDSFWPGNNGKDILQVGKIESDWDIETVSWHIHPIFGEDIYSEIIIDSSQASKSCWKLGVPCTHQGPGEYIQFNITELYKEWLSGEDNYGFYIMSKYGDYAHPSGAYAASGNYFNRQSKVIHREACEEDNVACEEDGDCGLDHVLDIYCVGNDKWQKNIDYSCINAGTTNSYCDAQIYDFLVEECEFGCADGECLICDPEQELIVNGDFEFPIIINESEWNIFASGTSGLGWDVEWETTETIFEGHIRPEPALLEIQDHDEFRLSGRGQYAELDSDWNGPTELIQSEPASIRISQDIETIPGLNYAISFYFSARPNFSDLSENELEFKWDGSVEDTIQKSSGWDKYEYTLEASSDITTIEFADLGIPNAAGTLIDDVSVRCILQ